jgi:hypothetical protein
MNQENNVSGDQNMDAADPTSVETNQAQEEQAYEESAQQEQNVPLAALQSERAKRQQVEDEIRMIKDHLALNQVQQSQQTQPAKNEFEGLEDGDVMTVGEFKKLTSGLTNKFQMTIEEMKMSQKNPDYQDVITRYLPDILKKNPGLKNTLQKSHDYELAYYLAKNSDAYRTENKQKKKSVDAQRIVANSSKTSSLSSMGSPSPISQARRYKDMTDDEFLQVVNRNLA